MWGSEQEENSINQFYVEKDHIQQEQKTQTITNFITKYVHHLSPLFFIRPLHVCSSSDADRAAALRSRDRETPELCPQHGRPLHRMDLCCWSHHGGKLPGNHSLISCIKAFLGDAGLEAVYQDTQ